MKTIEEKAEAYDKVFRTAQELYNNPASSQIGKDWICAIFPELKESEDEKIRKVLVELVKCNERSGYFMINNITTSSMLSWLEKQGEQEKTLCDKCKKAQPSHSCQDITALGRCAVEHEQKSTDKVEPKFHEGDWIIQNDKCSNPLLIQGQVIDVNGYYRCCDQNGETVTLTVFNVHNNFHLWTIKDAKEGDILADYSEAYGKPLIFILKKFEYVNFGLVRPSDYSSYCYLTAGDIQRFKEGTYHHQHNIKPATKEQCETLKKLMFDAGYTFDFEKKDLKKIETKFKPGDVIEFTGRGHTKYVIQEIHGTSHYTNSDGQSMDMPYTDANFNLVGQNLEWSEEDEEMVNKIVDYMKPMPIFFDSTKGKSGKEYTKEFIKEAINWLQSLKERYTWKPSDEQMDALQYVCRNLNPPLSDKLGWNSLKTLELMFEQLKKLKE